MFGKFSGSKVKLCPACQKETIHLKMDGDNCSAWFCRSCLLKGTYGTDHGNLSDAQQPGR